MDFDSTHVLFPAARTLLTATFIISAVRHALDWPAALDEMNRLGMPRSSLLMAGSVALRLVGGLMVLLGCYARVGAGLLLLFMLPATFLGHAFWSRPTQERGRESIEFLNNLAIAGGVALVALLGSGPASLTH